MTDISAIDAFLAQAMRALRVGKTAGWSLPEGGNWHEIWARIEFHGIALLLHRNTQELADWPDALLERMAEEARLMVLWETTHHKVISELLGTLHQAGVASVLMKGTAIAYSLHEEPAQRRRGDTDLLIDPKHKEKTRTILQDLEWYRKPDPHGLNFQEGWLHDAAGFFRHALDLHWEPSERAVLHPLLPSNLFSARKEPIPQFHPHAFRPDYAAMILHGAINQQWHIVHGYDVEEERISGSHRLIWSLDFILLGEKMNEADWQRLTDHCNAHGAGPLVAGALRQAAKDLDAPLPFRWIEQLETQKLHPDIAAYFTKLDGVSQFWLDLRKTHGIGPRLHLIKNRALPPRDHLMQKYPEASGWPTALLQGRLLVETSGRILGRLLKKVTAR